MHTPEYNTRKWIRSVPQHNAGIATVVTPSGSLSQSINQSINQSISTTQRTTTYSLFTSISILLCILSYLKDTFPPPPYLQLPSFTYLPLAFL